MNCRLLLLLGLCFFLFSCSDVKRSFSVSEVHFLTNATPMNDSLVKLPVDLSDAVLNGIEIPSVSQTNNGYFNFTFKIANNSGQEKPFYYKLFYQNKSYKFSENNYYANENFYGSWENNQVVFRSTPVLKPGQEFLVKDSFRITGNPRNEKIFYGPDRSKNRVSAQSINAMVSSMKNSPQVTEDIRKKAIENKISFEEQIYKDALWVINNQLQLDSSTNNRWKRNPRMGLYEFKLVVTTPEDFEEIPSFIKDLSQKNTSGNFVNPFVWFIREAGKLENTTVVSSDKELQVYTSLDLGRGVYVNPLSLDNYDYKKDFYSEACGDSIDKYSCAQVELFFHNINRAYQLHNIPVVKDVTGDNYTREEYTENVRKYEKSAQLIDTYVNSTDCPCRNVSVNKDERSITLKNPGNKEGEFKKEHVGIMTRVGFTYGKFRAKIKFPETLSKDHVWNGITNAFWLMAQEVNLGWNMRRVCDAEVGYIPKQEPDNEASLSRSKKQIAYSEIDFEILKESQFWPKSSYNVSNTSYKTDDCANNQDIMVTCTNWDMACQQPEFFNIGAMEHQIDGTKFIHHRWNKWYKALTTKTPASQDELFESPYYYYEIEWTPEKIVWRIGPEKDKMRTVCIMDKNVTAIPNNQMLMIITQEWHNQEWWPTAPYKQNFIPFPKNDIVGKVLELEIE